MLRAGSEGGLRLLSTCLLVKLGTRRALRVRRVFFRWGDISSAERRFGAIERLLYFCLVTGQGRGIGGFETHH